MRTRLWFLLMFFGLVNVGGAQNVATRNDAKGSEDASADTLLDRRVTVNLTGASLENAIRAIAAQAHASVLFNGSDLRRYQRPVTLRAEGESLRSIFRQLFEGTTLQVIAKKNSRFIVLDTDVAMTMSPSDSTATLSGTVIDSATRRPVARVTVRIEGSKLSALTSDSGRFTIPNVPVGPQVLLARLFGYAPTRQQITVTGVKPVTANFVMARAATQLSGVVTTATGKQQRKDVGSDIVSLDVDSISRIAPIRTVTDIIENRVPGLVVQHQSGVPGAPSRLRIRGIGSIDASNDPIIIIDGVRAYSEQTSERSPNDDQHSVLDNIDVRSIERVEVLKGPSASSLYGSDAANGVIVVTTKRGRAGPAVWHFSTQQERATVPNSISPIYYLQGTPLNGSDPIHCSLTPGSSRACIDETLFVLDPLRDSRTTVLGVGHSQRYTADVSGGTPVLQYFLSGAWRANGSPVKMSDADVAYLERTTKQSVPAWQRHPLSASAANGTSQFTAQVTPRFTVSLTNALAQSTREETPYSNVLSKYQGPSITPRDTLIVTGSLANFRMRTTSDELVLRNSASTDWNPRAEWSVHGDVGYETAFRSDRILLRRGDCPAGCLDVPGGNTGYLNQDDGRRSVTTVNLRASTPSIKIPGFEFGPSVGVQYVKKSVSDVSFHAENLALGSTTSLGAKYIVLDPEINATPVELGLYYAVRVAVLNRFRTSFGARVDASNSLGKNVKPTYPKLDFSYALSDEPFFPFKSTINGFRVRLAYGHSAVQPEIGAALRTYYGYTTTYDQQLSGPIQQLASVGNPGLRPERSTELEGGIDLDAFGSRFILSITRAVKVARDALVRTDLPLSLGGFQYTSNLGSTRNISAEVQTSAVLVDRQALRWSVNANYSRVRNRLESVAPGFNQSLHDVVGNPVLYGHRYVVGYPISGTWIHPVVSYADRNGDGVLSESEMVRSDSTVFAGSGLPSYDFSPSTQVGLFDGRLTVAAQFQYQHAIAQVNEPLLRNIISGVNSTLRPFNDRSSSLDEQAFMLSGYAALHTASLLRFSSLRAGFVAPNKFARLFRASAVNLALEGRNLGLWTNYSGTDPNVSGSIRGNQISDPGVLPVPREWGIDVQLTY